MADTVNFSWTYSVSKDGKQAQNKDSFSYTPTGHYKGFNLIQQIPTAGTTLNFGSVVSVASFAVENLDAANYVELSMNSDFTKPFAKILAGKSHPNPQATGQTVFAKANTAAVYVSTDFDGVT